jgi:hypothetical protein
MPKKRTTGDTEETATEGAPRVERRSIPATMDGATRAPMPGSIDSEVSADSVAGVAPTTGETRAGLIGAIMLLSLFQRRIVAALLAGLRERYPDGLPEWDEATRNEVVEAMLAAIPDSDLYDRQIGLFYTTTGVGRMKHLSNPTVLRYARTGRLLAIESAHGYFFPEFQFSARGDVPELLPEVVAILRAAGFDSWRIALWMTKSPSGKPSPIGLLNAGNGAAAVKRARGLATRTQKKGIE